MLRRSTLLAVSVLIHIDVVCCNRASSRRTVRTGFRVYALCMLGYGWSPKVEEPYSMEFWGQQVIDFAAEVAGACESDKAVVARSCPFIHTSIHPFINAQRR